MTEVPIKIHFRNGAVIHTNRPSMREAMTYVREGISYSGPVVLVYAADRCVHNDNWDAWSNWAAKEDSL
jgi:lactam utilization protein B